MAAQLDRLVTRTHTVVGAVKTYLIQTETDVTTHHCGWNDELRNQPAACILTAAGRLQASVKN